MSTKTKGARTKRQCEKNKSDKVDIDKIFDKMDLNHDGRISVHELTKAAQWIGLNPTRKEAEKIIEECNPSQPGYVTRSEFRKILEKQEANIDEEVEELVTAFRVFDKDNSGTITADEIRAVLKATGEDVTDDDIKEMLAKADADGNGNIDLYEFAAVMCSTD